MTIYSDVLHTDDEEDEDDIEAHEASIQRLKEADDATRQMTREEYQHYSDCRQVSFTYRKAKRFREFLNLPASEIDRSLVFPLCFAGCMTDDPALRRYFGDRLKAMDGPVGNCGKAMLLMEAVWSRRDNLGLVMSWRDVMRETQLELLLV